MPKPQNTTRSAKAVVQEATITPEAHEEHSAFPSHNVLELAEADPSDRNLAAEYKAKTAAFDGAYQEWIQSGARVPPDADHHALEKALDRWVKFSEPPSMQHDSGITREETEALRVLEASIPRTPEEFASLEMDEQFRNAVARFRDVCSTVEGCAAFDAVLVQYVEAGRDVEAQKVHADAECKSPRSVKTESSVSEEAREEVVIAPVRRVESMRRGVTDTGDARGSD
ncbi:hypothetical protein HDK90DRAFT_465325 [Phyllosticta capitalensis]|uniref:Uncharacterized protein n=1 Tax=Phyllosticta capitalensis TaxID=121624 RepID=A0ABR1YU72_9PEZI